MLKHAAVAVVVSALVLGSGCSRSGPPYSPEEALKKFQLPPGFRIELAAAEPQVVDPVAMAFDEHGRLFVVEMSDYPISPKPLGKIKLLEDRDGDGRFEHSTMFAEGLHFPHSVMPWKGGVLVASAPDILYLADTNGDGRVDVRRVVLTGFAQVNPQLRVNALTYGLDNWIYAAYPRFGAGRRFPQFSDLGKPIRFPNHPEIPPVDIFSRGMDLRFKPEQLKLEPVSGNSEYGQAFDAAGHRFPSWNDKHFQEVVIESRYLSRNPYLAVASTIEFGSDHGDSAEVYPIAEKPILREIRQATVMSQLGHFTSACGQSIYTGGAFPEPYQGAYFICEPVHNLVHGDRLTPKGASFRASRITGKSEFLASRDSWFMPVFTTTGPDGALYVVDFYRKIVEHPEWIRDDLVHAEKLFNAGNDRGRIYRIVAEGAKRRAPPRLDQTKTAELVRHLSDANGWWRITAQRLLVERGDLSAMPELRRLATEGSVPEGRMHALWALEGLDALDSGLVLRALNDSSPLVREQAVRLAEKFLSEVSVSRKLAAMKGDSDSHVRFQLACTMGGLPAKQSFAPLRELAARDIEDPWMQIAVLTSAKQNAGQWFAATVHDQAFVHAASEAKSAFLARITGIMGARRESTEIGQVIAAAGSPRSEAAWWQAASLRGLTDGLHRAQAGRMHLPAGQEHQLVALLEAPAAPVRAAAVELAVAVDLSDSSPLKAVIQRAARRLSDASSDALARAQAAAILGLDSSVSTLPLLESVFTPQQPEEVQLAAARALLGMPGARSTAALLKHWDAQTAAVRDVVLAGFLREPERVSALLDAIQAGKVPAASISRAARQRFLRVRDEGMRKRATALFANLSSDRGPIIAKYRPAAGRAGNFGRGREVFRENCSDCHKIGDLGVQVGPDLLAIGNQSKDELLGNILDPNANIAPGYEEYMIQTTDSKLITGVIAGQNATSVTLRRRKGEEDTVMRSNIAEMRVLTVSAMPENLEEGIDLDQMADLLEYLKAAGVTKVAGR